MLRTLAPSRLRAPAPLLLVFALVLFSSSLTGRQTAPADVERIDDRIRSLQREAEALAGQARTLVGDLRKAEIDRDLKAAQLRQAQAAATAAQQALQQTTDRLSQLELERLNQLPDIKAQLVDVYKRGRSGYAQMVFSAGNMRELARATRAVGALAAISERRVAEHRRTIEALRQERATFEERARDQQAKEADAKRAKGAADAAVAAATDLVRQIDSRRDLNAQYVGELQVAYDRIQQVAALGTGKPGDVTAVPLRPFQGALDWPVAGSLVRGFGRSANRLGGSVTRNGVDIGAAENASVRAIHGGTVGFSGPFAGFGTLVILDHGGNDYSLYGYLSSTALEQGQTVESGAEVGKVGFAPAGPAALYFEVRIDGRSVNPVQWLKPR